MTFRKILCPIDFSAVSGQALGVATRLAMEHDGELVIVHAWNLAPLFAGEFVYPIEAMRALEEQAEHGLAAAVTKARTSGVAKVSAIKLDGLPWHAIVDYAERTPDIDLIVLGTRGHTGLVRAVWGSVAEMVARHAPCSVLAVPDGGAQPFLRVLCPVDFSPSSRYALDLVPELSRSAEPSVTLLHVIEPPRVYSEEPIEMSLDTGLVGRAHALLDQWATGVAAKHPMRTVSEVRIGRARTEIRALLDGGNPFDLVAMGSHGRTGLRRAVLGSVAEETLRHAHRAVLVARERRA
jgi:nucleotide-binding universal stress UspA family protein